MTVRSNFFPLETGGILVKSSVGAENKQRFTVKAR